MLLEAQVKSQERAVAQVLVCINSVTPHHPATLK